MLGLNTVRALDTVSATDEPPLLDLHCYTLYSLNSLDKTYFETLQVKTLSSSFRRLKGSWLRRVYARY